MTRIVHWFFMWKMDPMSGCDIRLVFTLPPRDSTLQYKRCAHLWNNFPCIITLMQTVICKAENCITPCTSWTRLLKRSINTFYFSVSVSCHSELCELLVLSTKQNIPCTFVQSMNNTCCNSFNVLYASTSNIILRIKNNE